MTKISIQIRNSTAEFLVFTNQAGESTIDVSIRGRNGMAYPKIT